MREVCCTAFGPLEQLIVVERPSSPCGPGQVRVAVRAAGVNFVDALFVQGLYQIKPPLPFVPGNEVAGVVVEVGADVVTPAVGERVFANVGLGGYASEVVLDARRVMRTPQSLSDGQAATFTQSYLTAMFALRVRAGATGDQTLLVLGAGGGVGLAAVDVASAMGVRVLAAASTDAKRAVALAHGAEATVDIGGDIKQAAKEFAAPSGRGGVDIVYDPIGGAVAEPALRSLGTDGQYLVVGFASGAIPSLPANQVLLRNRRVIGVDWGGWVSDGNGLANQALLADVLSMIDAGRLQPVEPVTYSLDAAADALADQQHRRVTGKAALVP
jgi:NADPH2:quinone reductase